MRYKTRRFDDVTINYDKRRVPLSSMDRSKRQGKYRYYGAQGVIDFIDDYIFDGTYLLIAEDGENLKSNKQNIAQIVEGQFWVNNHAHIVQAREECNLRYLCYLINYIDLSGYITGSAQPKLSQANLNAVMLNLPDKCVQDRVVSVLGAIDNKINLNNKINDNLAEQIQAIYNNEFDPGTHTPSGRLSDICQYSSDRISVSDLTVSTYFSTENMQPNKTGAVDATSLPSISQTTRCHKGDVLISNIRPYFKKILYVSAECGCSTDVLCFTPKRAELSAFLYGTLFADRFFDYMVAGSKGTKMPRGDKQQIMNYPIVIPPQGSLQSYNGAIFPMLEHIACNRSENIRLAALRDTLLPRLMAGELDVSDLDL